MSNVIENLALVDVANTEQALRTTEALRSEQIRFYLNTALCQSPPKISKTAKAIQFMKHFGLLSRFMRGPVANGTHHITAVLTNNSLTETQQWKYRLNKTSDVGVRIRVLSSKKKTKDNYMSLESLIHDMVRSKTASDLPDMLVMCTHSKRANDLYEFIKILKKGNMNFARIGIHHITLSIMFDEADKNIALISDCLRQIDTLVTDKSHGKRMDDVLRDVHFITATPFETFWKTLSSIGIDSLKNLNSALKDMDPDSVLHISQKELMLKYRYLSEHNHRKDVDCCTEDPVDYVARVITIIRYEEGLKPRGTPLTLFAPSATLVGSHNAMKNMLLSAGIGTVLIMNGQNKGFYTHGSPNKPSSVDEFNSRHDVHGELKDTLVKWRELYPMESIAITGNYCIQRGVTFNTQGFNFTDLIVSHYHMKDLEALIQLLGRGNGGKEYVDIMNIWAPDEVVKAANARIALVNELLSKDPAEFKGRDFREMTKKERMEVAMTVPIVIQLTKETYSEVASTKKGRTWDETSIIRILETRHAGLSTTLRGLKKSQISEIQEKTHTTGEKAGTNTDSYKKHILDYVNASIDSPPRKFVSDVKPKQRATDFFQMFLDPFEHRVIVSAFYGSRLSAEEEEDDDSVGSTEDVSVISHA